MKRELLERYQVLVYLVAVGCGLLVGSALPERVAVLESMLWPLLMALLFTTFTQVPLAGLHRALMDAPFLRAAIVGNFVLLPLVVWALLLLAPPQPAIRLGILLVLLVPCTDWFITFTQLGGGSGRHAIAFSPISLLLQLLLLPGYLWLLLGTEFAVAAAQREMLLAFALLIVLPLLLAFAMERWALRHAAGPAVLGRLGALPVPLLAAVVFSIAATQVGVIRESTGELGRLLLIFALFLVIAGLLARALARLFALPAREGRTLAFSLGSRNSFVVLPLALALPPSFELVAVVIVFQSLVELIGMAVYLWWVPQRLFPDR